MRLDGVRVSLLLASSPPAPGLTAGSCSCGRGFAFRFLQLHLAATPCGSARVGPITSLGIFHPLDTAHVRAHVRRLSCRRLGGGGVPPLHFPARRGGGKKTASPSRRQESRRSHRRQENRLSQPATRKSPLPSATRKRPLPAGDKKVASPVGDEKAAAPSRRQESRRSCRGIGLGAVISCWPVMGAGRGSSDDSSDLRRHRDLYDHDYFHGKTSGYPSEGYARAHPDWGPWIELLAALQPRAWCWSWVALTGI